MGALVAVAGWSQLRAPRRDIGAARAELVGIIDQSSALTAPDSRTAALAHIDTARTKLARARADLGRSWALKTARFVPVISRQRNGALTLVDNAAAATDVARQLLVDVNAVAGTKPLAGGTVPLDALGDLAGTFRTSADAIARLRVPPGGLWGELGRAGREFRQMQKEGPDRLRSGADVLDAGRHFLGGEAPRSYLIAAQNNAEMRDQGMVLSYAVLGADKGKLALGRHGRITDLAVTSPVDIALPEGTRTVFSDAPRSLWQNVNITADFSLSGRLMVALYGKSTKSSIDGVIAVDVPALSRLLQVLGPVQVPGLPETLTAENASRLLLHDLYQGVPPGGANQETRYEKLGEAVGALFDKVRTGSFDVAALGVALADAARGGHFRLFSTHGDEQQVFEDRRLSGGPALGGAARTFHVAVQNGTALKLDYFVKPIVEMAVEIDKSGTATVRTKITVDNTVPADSPPSYQVGPDPSTQGDVLGRYATRVDLWGPHGSDQLGSVDESGLELTQQVLKVDAASREVAEFTTVIPHAIRNGRLVLRFVPQPRLEPMPLIVKVTTPGWRLTDQAGAEFRARWDSTVNVAWRR